MEFLLNNLKKYVECSICLENFTEPKTIACLHTFCSECLKKHALLTQRDGPFRCPECQTQISIPEGNRFDQLPTSFLHNSLLSLLTVQKSGDSGEVSCGICKKKSAEGPKVSYCFECEKLLCSGRANAHELFQTAAFQGHKVTPVKQFQVDDYEALLKRNAFCTEKYHEGEVTRFYCRPCEVCICHICINTDHRNHQVEPLEKAADVEKGKILAEAKSMGQKSQVCRDVIRQLEDTAVNLQTNIAAAKQEVSRVTWQMILGLRDYELEAINVLENTGVSRMKKLDATKKEVEMLTRQIDQATEFATTLAQSSSWTDLMGSSKGSLEKRFEALHRSKIPAVPVTSYVKFVPTSELDTLSLGFVRISETDANRSKIEGLEQAFQAGVEADISISPITDDGQFSNKRHEDSVEVMVEPADHVTGLTINEDPDGRFHVKFVPKLPGAFQITAKINGESLAKSPFNIVVRERRIELKGELDPANQIVKEPTGISVNGKGQIAVADYDMHCILLFDKEGKFKRQLGCYGKNLGQLDYPVDVTFLNDDEILVAEESNRRIQQFNICTGTYVNSFGRYGTGNGEFRDPVSVCLDDQGQIVVAEDYNNRVQVFAKDGTPMFNFGDSGPEKLNFPKGCVFYKNMLIVSDSKNGCLKVFDSTGKFLRKIGEKGKEDGQFRKPWGLCVDHHENLLVTDYGLGRVQQFTIEGQYTGKIVSDLQGPEGITTMADGRILVSDYDGGRVLIMA